MAKVELKQPIVDEIKAQLDGAKSMVVVDYRGISVADVTELRKQCREAGVVYKVYKNTMVKRAVEGLSLIHIFFRYFFRWMIRFMLIHTFGFLSRGSSGNRLIRSIPCFRGTITYRTFIGSLSLLLIIICVVK